MTSYDPEGTSAVLAEVCQRLSKLVDTEPFEQMQHQMTEQQQQNSQRVSWLSEAFALLDAVTNVECEQQRQLLTEKIELFIRSTDIGQSSD